MPPQNAAVFLLSAEGHTVGALVHSRIAVVGANQNALQGAVDGLITVVCALLNGTFDALVCIAIHCVFLLLRVMVLV